MASRVGIYARTSRAEENDPTSIPVQLADCRECADEHGWHVEEEYVDPGITGWKRKTRPNYERLVAAVEAGEIDIVLCRDYERLLRNDKEGARWLDLFETQGFHTFAFADEADIDLRRARDRKDWKERVAAAVYYSDRLSEKVRRTKEARKAGGVYGGGGPAYGYRKGADGPTVDPEQAAVIHGLVKRLAEGASLHRLSMDLNAAGEATASKGRWFPTTVRRLLQGEHLAGANGYPAILSETEAAIVRSALGDQPKAPRGRPKARRYALAGYLYCSECGVKLSTGQRRYRCSVSHGGCGTISILASPLERYLALETFLHHVETTRASKPRGPKKAAAPPAADTSPLLAELREVEGRAEEVAAGIAEGTLSVSVGGNAARQIERRRRELMEALAFSIAPVETGAKLNLSGLFSAEEIHSVDPTYPVSEEADLRGQEFRERWEERSLSEAEVAQLGDLFAEYLDRVTISRREVRGRTFDPSRVSVSFGG